MAPSPPRRVAFVATMGSRHGEDAFGRAQTFLRSAGVRVDAARLVRGARRLPDVVRAELATGVDLLIVGGGDGAVNCAVAALVERRGAGWHRYVRRSVHTPGAKRARSRCQAADNAGDHP